MIGSVQAASHRVQGGTRSGIDCVYLTSFGAEYSPLALISQYSGIRLRRAASLEEADFLLTVTEATTFVSDVTFPDGDWRDALAMAAALHPSAAALIAADPVDRAFLKGAEALWVCGIIWKPFDFIKAIDAIRTADQASRDRTAWLAETVGAGATLRR